MMMRVYITGVMNISCSVDEGVVTWMRIEEVMMGREVIVHFSCPVTLLLLTVLETSNQSILLCSE